jgi:hypothetical protein
MDTILTITGMGIAPYSARGLTQTLEPIEAAAQLRRTINGDLHDLSQAQFRKYRSTITCTDMVTPAIDGIFPGAEVEVECAAFLTYPTGNGAQRPVVPGSAEVNGSFTTYRPILQMRVVAVNVSDEEYAASKSWSLELEEI